MSSAHVAAIREERIAARGYAASKSAPQARLGPAPGRVIVSRLQSNWYTSQTRKNGTRESTTDPEAKLSYLGHALMENRNGLAVAGP